MEPVRLYKGTVFGTVIPIKEVNPRDGEEVCGTGVACGGLEPPLLQIVPGFYKVAAPLNVLTRKDIPYIWTPNCQQAFEQLKKLLTSAPLLKYPDFTKPFVLETDPSRRTGGSISPTATHRLCLLRNMRRSR